MQEAGMDEEPENQQMGHSLRVLRVLSRLRTLAAVFSSVRSWDVQTVLADLRWLDYQHNVSKRTG